MPVVLLLALLAAAPSAASAAPAPPVRVVVLSSASVPQPGNLMTALRIQLGRRARVDAGPAVQGNSGPSRVSSAMAAADARGATIAVWLERSAGAPSDQPTFTLHVVARRANGIVQQEFRLVARPGPHTDRALALKVTDVVDGQRRATPSPPPIPPVRPRPAAPVYPWLGLGGSIAAGNGSPGRQWGLDLRGGVARDRVVTTAVYGALHLDRGVSTSEPVGDLSTRELQLDVGVAVIKRVGRTSFGADVRAGARLIRARGVTAAGTSGTTWVTVPRMLISAVGGWQFSPGFAVQAELGGALATRRRRFAVNGVALVDVGRFRLQAGVFAVFSIR